MKTSDFSFNLPRELVAQYPSGRRGESRMMAADPRTGRIEHSTVAALPSFIEPGSVVVVNDSKVRKARLFARAASEAGKGVPGVSRSDEGEGVPGTQGAGSVEFLLIDRLSDRRWRALVSRAKKQRVGRRYDFEGGVGGTVVGEEGELRVVEFTQPVDDAWLELNGHVPLPPYISRRDEAVDADRYQTIYAAAPGSAAAPTAGLHFTEEILARLREHGVSVVEVTLHVGPGTFVPIRSAVVEEHHMHEESYEVSEETARCVTAARREGRSIVAVGTTVLRTLESAWKDTELSAGRGSTRLFIYPGYRFQAVDILFTNFHTPASTLLVLVSAFAGSKFIQRAYVEAIKRQYHFFSYGDAMLVRRMDEPGDQ